MLTPITDRSSASAVVPLVLTVPDEVTDKFNHITFDKQLDSEARAMREEAIKRFALGADAPPELLTGNADMNHWNGWLTREDVVSNHIEPVLGLICDALTTQFVRPVLLDNDYANADEYVVWYDVKHLVVRNNLSGDAKDLFAAGAISEMALRSANGFDDDDAPAEKTAKERAAEIVLTMVQANPGLMRSPGTPALVTQILALIEGKPEVLTPPVKAVPDKAVSTTPKAGGSALPVTSQTTPPSPSGLKLMDAKDYGLRGSLSQELGVDDGAFE